MGALTKTTIIKSLLNIELKMPGYCVFYFLYKIPLIITDILENIRDLNATLLSPTSFWNDNIFRIT